MKVILDRQIPHGVGSCTLFGEGDVSSTQAKPLLLDLAQIREAAEPFELERDFSELDLPLLGGDISRLIEPVHCRCRVVVTGELVRVTGDIRTRLELTCCRCLGPFEQKVEKSFSLDYSEDPKVETEHDEISLSYEDLGIGFYRNDELDLGAALAEQVLLEIPMKPVCGPECQGLCDQCGANLNEGPCGCDRRTEDPRWAALAKLKDRLKS